MVHANLGCLHFPYEDPYAWELAMRVLAWVNPDQINLLGDIYDFDMVSGRPVDWRAYQEGGLQGHLDHGYARLSELREVVGRGTPVAILPGNHDEWMLAYLGRHPELSSLRSLELPSLWRTSELGFSYHEYEIPIAPGLIGVHGDIVRKEAGDSVLAQMARARYQTSIVMAHVHRQAKVHVSSMGKTYTGVETGCLVGGMSYIRNPNWQRGLSLTTVTRDDFDTDLVLFRGSGKEMRALVWGDEVRL